MKLAQKFLLLILFISATCPVSALSAESDLFADSLYWVPIHAPYNETLITPFVLNDTLAWIVTESQHLYQWNGERWDPLPLIPGEKVNHLYAFSENDIWIAVRLDSLYRSCVKHFDGKQWHLMKTPNVTPILKLFFTSSKDGWAICQWGEIIHYDGKSWRRVRSPTNYHLDFIYMTSPESGWIGGENRGKGILLKYENRRWKIFHQFEDGEVGLIVANDSICWVELACERERQLYQFSPDNYCLVPFPEVDSTLNKIPEFDLFEVNQQIGCHLRDSDRFYIYTSDGWRRLPWQVLNPSRKITAIGWIQNNFLSEHNQLYQLKRFRKLPQFIEARHKPFKKIEVPIQYAYGVAVGDMNSDDFLDIYVVDHLGINHLIGGQFSAEGPFLSGSAAAAEKAGISGKVISSPRETRATIYDAGISMADIDNDGNPDLYLCSMYHPNILFENVRKGRFKNSTQKAGVGGQKMAFTEMGVWGDVNNDGNIDLFVANVLVSNNLHLNDGTGRFEDVTAAAGLTSAWGSRNPAFGDFDNDNDLDLFIGHSTGRIRLMQNLGIEQSDSHVPRFQEVTIECGLDTSIITACRCGIWGDVDNDGDLDLFLTYALIPDKLYLNDGTGHFTDVSIRAGFTDSTNSVGAVFFDADNDGWLDLFVGHEGSNRFYQNQKNGTFRECATEFGLADKGCTKGIASGDFGELSAYSRLKPDGAIDLYVGNFEGPSIMYINTNIQNNFFKFKLVGTRSNRDAIGAKVYLYDAGHLGEKNYFHGLRDVQAGGGYCSMSSTIIHFGADSKQKYDVRIVFPSGIEVVRQNLTPGQSFTIYEEEGRACFISVTQRWLWRNLRAPENHRQALYFLIFVALIFAAYKCCRRLIWGTWLSRVALMVVPMVIYLLLKTITVDKNRWLFDGLPFAFGVVVILLILGFNYLLYRQINREERLHELLSTCRSFEHSQWLASYLNQIKLLFINVEPGQKLPEDVIQLTYEAVNSFYQFVYPEIQRIEQLSAHAFLECEERDVLKYSTLKLSQYLDEAKIEMNLRQLLRDKKLARNICHLVGKIQTNLRLISQRVDYHFSSPLKQTIEQSLKRHRSDGLLFEVNNSITDKEIYVRIRRPDLAFVLENLLSNARSALLNQVDKKITITIEQVEQRLKIYFRDNGCGIPPPIQQRLFEHGVSTKKSIRGGFGLYRSRELVTKYGGTIQLVRSVPGEGTEFLVELKRIG